MSGLHFPWEGDAFDLLREAIEARDNDIVDHPHIVVCRDADTRQATYRGPFPNGLAALLAAEDEFQSEVRVDPSSRLRFTVAPLYP